MNAIILYEGRKKTVKAIVCEMCGSNDVVKQGGVYVCQNCGTKYDPEDAKKLMVEVKVDNSEKTKNLYSLARRSLSDKNYQDAANYYQQIAVEVPYDWEAYFYNVLCKARTCKIKEVPSALMSVFNCIDSTFKLIDKFNYEGTLTGETTQKDIAILRWASKKTVLREANSFADDAMVSVDDARKETKNDPAIKQLYFDSLRAYGMLKIKCGELEDKKIAAQQYCNILKIVGNETTVFTAEEKKRFRERAKELDPNCDLPAEKTSGSGGGCYVATAVYGSYDCPQVWTLRRYRDNTLAETWYGRAFVRAYYAVSPTLVKWFGKTDWFKNMWKPALDKMVKELNENGFADTPYHDRDW